jgi:hypothetical protein
LLLFDGRAPTPEGYETLARIAERATARWGDLVRPAVVVLDSAVPGQLASLPKDRVWLDPKGALHARFGAGAECLYLIRPDGYVGFRAQPADGAALERYMARILL